MLLLIVTICLRYVVLNGIALPNKIRIVKTLDGMQLGLLIYFAILVCWVAYSFNEFNTTIPSTLWTKLAQGHSGFWPSFQSDLFNNFIKTTRGNQILIIFVLFGIITGLLDNRLSNVSYMLVFWILIYVIAYSALGVPNYEWYYWPIYFGVAIFIPLSVAKISLFMPVDGIPKTKVFINTALRIALLYSFFYAYSGGVRIESLFKKDDLYNLSAKIDWQSRSNQFSPQQQTYIEFGKFLNDRCNNQKDNLVASDEIGIIGFVAKNCYFVDMPGILDKVPTKESVGRFTADDQSRIDNFIIKSKPRFIVLREKDYPFVYTIRNKSGDNIIYQRILDSNKKYLAFIYERQNH